MSDKVAMLKPRDIFDFYGCQFLASYPGIDAEDVRMAEERIEEVYGKYLLAARERIKAECRFLGIEGFELSSIKKMLSAIKDLLSDEISQQASKMAAMGTGFNMGKMVVQANMMAGRDVGNLAKEFGLGQEKPKKKNSIDADSLVKDPKWHVIASAFQQLEDARTTNEKALAIDRLNGLQHNSFHLLIDLQTGRMLEGRSEDQINHNEAVNNVKDVLTIKAESKSPLDFADKMSSEVRKALARHRFLLRPQRRA